MRFLFKSDELADIYQTGSSSRWHPNLIKAFSRVIDTIAVAPDERTLRDIKSLHMEKLAGQREGQYSVRLNEQFRLIFTREKDDEGNYLLIIEMVDYHKG